MFRGKRIGRIALAALLGGTTVAGVVPLLASPAGAVVLDTTEACGAVEDTVFEDEASLNDEANAAADCASAYGIIGGKDVDNDGDPEVAGSDNLTRGQAATITVGAAEAAGYDFPNDDGSDPFVDDDDPNNPHNDTAATAANEGWINGKDVDVNNDGITPDFDSNANVTRGQMVAFFVRMLESLGVDIPAGDPANPTYSDVPATDPFFDEVEAAAALGLIQSPPEATAFNGGNSISRAQAMIIVSRMVQLLVDEGLIDPIGGNLQDIAVDPAGPAILQVSTAFGTANGQRAARTYTATIPAGIDVIDVALINVGNLTAGELGAFDAPFRDRDNGVSGDGRADGLGQTPCRIEAINGVTRATGAPATAADDYVDNVAVTASREVEITINCEAANSAVIPVFFNDADDDDQLDLDTDGNPTEAFGLGGVALIIPQEAGVGEFVDFTAIAQPLLNLVTTSGLIQPPLTPFTDFEAIQPPGGPPVAFFYNDTDIFTYQAGTGDPGQPFTVAQFEAHISGTSSGNRDDAALIAPYFNACSPDPGQRCVDIPSPPAPAPVTAPTDTGLPTDGLVLGDVLDIDYNPDGANNVDIDIDTPNAVTAVAAAPSDSDADGATDDMTITFTRPANLEVDRFDIYRAPVVNGAIPNNSFVLTSVAPQSVPATAATTYTFNDQNVGAAGDFASTSPQREVAYIVLAVNAVEAVNEAGNNANLATGAPGCGATRSTACTNEFRSPDSNIARAIAPVAANTARPAITSTTFNPSVIVGQNVTTMDEGDQFTLTFINGPLTLAAGATIQLRDQDGSLATITCGASGTTCAIGGPTSNELTVTLAADLVPTETGTITGIAIDDVAIVAITGVTNANGAVNLAESGVDGNPFIGSELSEIQTAATPTRTRVIADTDNDSLPANLDDDCIAVNAGADRITIIDPAASGADACDAADLASLTAGDQVNVFDRAGTQIATATFPAIIPVGGFPIVTSPAFAPGDRLFLNYIDQAGVGNNRLPSESTVINNPADAPSVVCGNLTIAAAPTSNQLNVPFTEVVTVTPPVNKFQVFDAQNSVLVATATAAAGSPGQNIVLTLDQVLTSGTTYVLRVAAGAVQDNGNLANPVQTCSFVAGVAPVPPGPAIVGANFTSPTNDNTPSTSVGTATAAAGRTVTNVTFSVAGATTIAGPIQATPQDGAYNSAVENFVVNTPVLNDGVNNVTITATDNTGGVTQVVRSVTVDTVAPAAPVITNVGQAASSLDLVDDDTPFVTGDSTPNINGTCETGSTVTLFDTAVSEGTGPCTAGTFSILDNTPEATGTTVYTVRQTDAGGNQSALGANTNVRINTTDPIFTGIDSSVGSNVVTLHFDLAVCESAAGAIDPTDFTVTVGGAVTVVNADSFDFNACTQSPTITLNQGPAAGQDVVVTINSPTQIDDTGGAGGDTVDNTDLNQTDTN